VLCLGIESPKNNRARREIWLDMVFRRSHSSHSKHAMEMALKAFDRAFGDPIEVVINRVKSGEVDVFSLFDSFVADLDNRGLSPNSIRGYLSRVKQYFAYNDVFLDKEKFRVKVVLPRIEEPDDRAPTVEELRKILSWGKLRTKALILVLASSGMRLGEAIKLRVKDLDFKSKPVKVKLSPAVASKTGQRRITFISEEATEYLLHYLGERIDSPNDWLFVSEADNTKHVSDDRAWRTIINSIDRAGLGKKNEATIQGRRKIHPHSFRKFFFSKTVGVIGETASHALMGHSSYMKTYYRITEKERTKDYLKCMPYVTIFSESPEKTIETDKLRKKQVLDTVKLLGFSEEKIRRVEEALAKYATVDNAVEEIRKLGLESHNVVEKSNNDPKKIVDESQLENYLAKGWDLQTILPSGKILIRK
jgi:integrase